MIYVQLCLPIQAEICVISVGNQIGKIYICACSETSHEYDGKWHISWNICVKNRRHFLNSIRPFLRPFLSHLFHFSDGFWKHLHESIVEKRYSKIQWVYMKYFLKGNEIANVRKTWIILYLGTLLLCWPNLCSSPWNEFAILFGMGNQPPALPPSILGLFSGLQLTRKEGKRENKTQRENNNKLFTGSPGLPVGPWKRNTAKNTLALKKTEKLNWHREAVIYMQIEFWTRQMPPLNGGREHALSL